MSQPCYPYLKIVLNQRDVSPFILVLYSKAWWMFIDIYTRATETLVETENQSRALLKQTFAIPIGIRVSF